MKRSLSKVIWFLFSLLIIASLTLIGCSKATTTSSTTTTQKTTSATTSATSTTQAKTTSTTATTTAKTTTTTDAKSGGTLIYRPAALSTSLGWPAGMTGSNSIEQGVIYADTLLRYGKDGKPVPWLATSWQYSADMKSLILKLRNDVKFQDNTDFNAAAVKTNLEICKAAGRSELATISSIDVVDTYTVRFNLSSIDAYLIPNLAEPVALMMSPAALAKGEDFCRTNAVGTGPFKQVEYKAGTSITFTKWDGYWQKGKPYLDGVKLVNIPDNMTALASFQKGEIHIMQTQDPGIFADIKNISKIGYAPQFRMLLFDNVHQNGPFGDIKVRQAVAYALDGETIAKTFGAGYWQPANQLTNKSTLYYNPNVIGYPYNLQKAKAKLAETGYTSGFKSSIYFTTSFPQEIVCTAIAAMMEKINITLSLNKLASAANTALQTQGWEGIMFSLFGTAAEIEPARLLNNLVSPSSTRYVSVARSAEYDTLLSLIRTETDFDTRAKLNQQLMKQIYDIDCMGDMVVQDGVFVVKPLKLNDDSRMDPWLFQWTPENAWFSK